uniref:Uncharacterized protein n=1 Tax=Anguilla anguilla TaxID=7936 RepID=A0A0E9VUY4_ANGAN
MKSYTKAPAKEKTKEGITGNISPCSPC